MNSIPIKYLAETNSTMTDSRRMIDEGIQPPFAVRTGYQSEGRGRTTDRKWESGKNVNLMFTLVVSLGSIGLPLTILPLAAGLCLCLSVEKLCGLQPSVKWPNDLLIQNQKVSGILCETYKKNLLVGAGLNIGQTRFDPDIEDKAGSLLFFTDNPPAPEIFLETFLNHWRNISSLDIHGMINDRLYRKNEIVEFLEGDTLNPVKTRGLIKHIAADGALVMGDLNGGNRRSYYSGEISFHLPE